MKLPIDLKGKDINNEEITIEITNLRRFGIERQNLSSIDLSPLESLENKEQVIMFVAHENFLEEIDLSFLKGCENLSVLYLFCNNLKEIDLTPLKYCSKLNKLNLHNIREGIEYVELILLHHKPYDIKMKQNYDVYVDDNPNLVEPIKRLEDRTLLLFDQPWNQESVCEKNVYRVYDWNEINEKIREL